MVTVWFITLGGNIATYWYDASREMEKEEPNA